MKVGGERGGGVMVFLRVDYIESHLKLEKSPPEQLSVVPLVGWRGSDGFFKSRLG